MSPPTPEFDAFAQSYDADLQRGLDLTGETKDYFAAGRLAFTRKLLAGETIARIFDFGCGTGDTAPAFHQTFPQAALTGSDPSEESLALGRSNHGSIATFVGMDALDTIAPCDLAYCNGVFHHILPKERDLAFKQVFDRLRPGGHFAFWENNPWNPMTRFIMSRVAFDRDAIMLFPAESRARLRKAGFEVLATRFLFIFPSILKALRPLEPLVSALPLGGQYLVLARKPLA